AAADAGPSAAGPRLRARPASFIEKTWKAAKRRPAVAAGIGAAVLAVVVVVTVVLVANAQLKIERDAADMERERVRVAQAKTEEALRVADRERGKAQARLEQAVEAAEKTLRGDRERPGGARAPAQALQAAG